MSKPSKTRASRLIWSRALQLQRQKRFSTVVNVGLVLLGPILVLGTYLVLGPLEQNARSNVIRLVVMADIIYVLVTVAFAPHRCLYGHGFAADNHGRCFCPFIHQYGT